MKHFIVKILVVSIVMALIGWLVFTLYLPGLYLPVLPYMLLFFLIITILVHAWQFRISKKDFGKFARTNMMATFLKLVIYSIFAIVYIANDRENAMVFVVCLAMIYLIFSFLEVSELSKISRKK